MNAKLELIRELEKRGLDDIARKVKEGEFSDLASRHAFPVIELARQLEAAGRRDLASRVRNGDFDHER